MVVKKIPTINTMDQMTAFMSKKYIEILNPLPTKSVLLEKICKKNLKKNSCIIVSLHNRVSLII